MAFEPFYSIEFRDNENRLAIFRWDPDRNKKIDPVVFLVTREEAFAALDGFVATGEVPKGWSQVTYWGPYKRPREGMQEVPPDRLVMSREGVCEMSGVASVKDVTALISRLLN